jgi:hypothetical protein
MYHPKQCKKKKLKMHETLKLMKDSLHLFAQKSFAYSSKIRISNSGFIIAHIKQKEYLLYLFQYQLTIISINLSVIKFPPTGNHSRIPNITSFKSSRILNKRNYSSKSPTKTPKEKRNKNFLQHTCDDF